jgi:hypothetical protein
VNFALKTSVIRDLLESRGVEYQTRGSLAAVPVTDLPGKVGGSVFPLRCFGEIEKKDATPSSVSQVNSEKRPGVLVAGFGDAKFFQALFLEIQNTLTSSGVQVANKPSSFNQVNGDSFSIENALTVVRRQQSDSLLYVTLENSGGKLRAALRCFDARGSLLWQENITSKFAITFEGAARNVVSQVKDKLKERVGKPGLLLR